MNRQQELAELLLDYLTDWTDTEEDCRTIEESIKELKMYGSTFDNPGDTLVKSALRHFIGVINPWNKNAIPEILKDMDFSEMEIEQHLEQLYY